MNNFLATGGDGFTVFNEGTNSLGGAQDIDALIAYFTAAGTTRHRGAATGPDRRAGGLAGTTRELGSSDVPWAPELFSAPALQRVLDRYDSDHMRSVPFFDGLMAGEIDALLGSFAGVPELHHPVRGRIRGESAFRQFVADMTAWMTQHRIEVEHVNFLLTDPRGFEEVVLHLDGDSAEGGRISLPVGLAADHDQDAHGERIIEMRLYFSPWPLTGHHATRLPLLQPDVSLALPDVVEDYQRGLASGGVRVERCTVTDDGRACALEYNVVARDGQDVPPSAGLAVHVYGDGGQLADVRVYGDSEPAAR